LGAGLVLSERAYLPARHQHPLDCRRQNRSETVLDVETGQALSFASDNPELLANGNVLIADEGNNRAIEVTHVIGSASTIVASFTASGTAGAMAFASRLPNGNTLLTDAGNNRIVEVNSTDSVLWEYVTTDRPGSNPAPAPTRAVRLANGNSLISDQFNDQVIEVNQAKQIVAAYGTINTPGYSPKSALTRMNAPYSAYVIGDYTGITPPF